MDANQPIRDNATAPEVRAAGPAQGQAATRAHADTGRWWLTLERRWSRKLDEVLALTAVCEGASAAGDDAPGGAATLPAQRLSDKANAALDDLGDLADAIGKIDNGTNGLGNALAHECPGVSGDTGYPLAPRRRTALACPLCPSMMTKSEPPLSRCAASWRTSAPNGLACP